MNLDVIVLGGGAAGLMCAMVAARRGRRTLVLEGSNKVGKKILMSGGGRCNFTNLNTRPSHFLSANPHFCKSALSRYTPQDFLTLVQAHGVAYHEKAAGQLFCDHSSRDILDLLVAECRQSAVQIRTSCKVSQVRRSPLFKVTTSQGEFVASSLVVATGGLSIPRMGASDLGYRLARQFGLRVRATRAGLVPLTFSGPIHDLTSRLSGVSVAARVHTDGATFDDDLLFTHRGLSGPAALQISSYWREGQTLKCDLLPRQSALELLLQAKLNQPGRTIKSVANTLLPRALSLELQALAWPDLAGRRLGEIANRQLEAVARTINSWCITPAGTEGYRTAEVTLGGVDTDELSSTTMESRAHPGLFFVGEVVDVTGHLGGFNFQWAWASAQAAGQVA